MSKILENSKPIVLTIHFPPPEIGHDGLSSFFDQAEAAQREHSKEMDKRLKKALRIETLCSILRAFPFGQFNTPHYSWCSHDEWAHLSETDFHWHKTMDSWNSVETKISSRIV